MRSKNSADAFMSMMPFHTFRRLASQGNLVPLVLTLNADTETPVSAFLKMTRSPYRFLFESMEGGDNWGRYSFLGSEPSLVLKARGQQIELVRGKSVKRFRGDPLEFLRQELRQYRPVVVPGLPRFSGGWLGYFGYDTIRRIEKIPDLRKDALPFDDCQLMLQDTIVVFDNRLHRLSLVTTVSVGPQNTLRRSYEDAVARLQSLARRLRKTCPAVHPRIEKFSAPRSNTSRKRFFHMVEKAQTYIRAGDIFQVVLSQRWQAPFRGPPFEIYRRLRQVNPSPYLFFLEMDGQSLAGSSPEVMVRLEGERVTVRPIAGTRRRGRDEVDEAKMEQEMRSDPKEIAEHVMLVDLGRNDIGRVAKTGSVKVTESLAVEKYSHVMHLVSNVEGELAPPHDAIDVLKATFPAGTLSGAPKIRAMEIIEELEVARRGPYGGAVGYIDFYGNMDMAIAIRSLAFAEGKVWFQSGGGIVLDSKPELEYLESQNKARVMKEVLSRHGS